MPTDAEKAEWAERLVAAAMGVSAVECTDCGCPDPKAQLSVQIVEGKARLMWFPCSNCGGYPTVSAYGAPVG